ncbi:MAG: MarR family winged helix-turn-helix transcriptional regulator [Acidimicrobiales bacterium]
MPVDPEADAAAGPVVEAVLRASRALVAVAARSLAGAGEDVTLPQYRAMVVLAGQGPQGVAALAGALGVSPSTATRMCDRLVRKGLVRRRAGRQDRRQVRLALTEAGRRLVDDVSDRRRGEIARIVGAVPGEAHGHLVEALEAFAEAAGELSDRDWAAGWTL